MRNEHVIVELPTGRTWVRSRCRRISELAMCPSACGGCGLCAMPVASDTATRPRDAECRRIRLAASRERLESLLEIALAGRADIQAVMSGGLACMSAYRNLKDEGLAHAFTIRDDGSRVIVLAGTSRVWRKRSLKRGMLAIRRRAARLGQRVVLVSERGLRRAIARDRTGCPRGPNPSA